MNKEEFIDLLDQWQYDTISIDQFYKQVVEKTIEEYKITYFCDCDKSGIEEK